MKENARRNSVGMNLLSVFLMLLLSVDVYGVSNVKLTLLSVDSLPNIKTLVNMQVVGKRLYVTYENPKRWGSQLLRTYWLDEASSSLKMEYEYFRDPAKSNGIDYPILVQDSLDSVSVMDRTYPLVYNLDMKRHTMKNTHKFVFSAKSRVPYAMALNVPFAYRKSDAEFYFVGRQPNMGVQAVYKSFSDSTATRVEEVEPLLYTKKYPAWTTNLGKQTFNKHTHVLVHGFYIYPAMQYVDLEGKQNRIVKLAEPNWKSLKPVSADVWDVNLIQIKDVTSSESYVYALWWNKTHQSMALLRKQNKAACKLVVLDWTGNIKNTYMVPRYMSNIVALDNSKLIGSDGKKFWLITLE